MKKFEEPLFNKCIAFTDIHYGKSSNSEEYNKKCDKFVDWVIDEGKKNNAETCIFLGDWHDSRISVHVKTLNYSLAGMEKLGNAFKNFYLISGNHDLYHRAKRDFNSVEFARNISNCTIINEPTFIGQVGLVPWLVSDEWKGVVKQKCRYMFGHFELPHFLMNQMLELPDHGGLKASDLANIEYVFSGHFHKRQNKGNVWYIGNAFPQNYTDAGDDDRGAMIFEWGGKPTFKTWPEQPIFRNYNLSDILADPEKYIMPRLNAKVTVDVDLTYEEAHLLKESFVGLCSVEDIKFVQKHKDVEEVDWEENVSTLQTVDQIVISGLQSIDDNSAFDKSILVNIYRQLG